MKDRIQKYMDYKNINAGELAINLEVQRSNISHILNGRNKPSAAFIEKMLMIYPDLNARWLLTGQGEMIEGSLPSNQADPKAESETFSDEYTTKSTAQDANEREKPHSVEKESSSENQLLPNILNDDVDKVVLLYRDGSFSAFKKR